MESCPMSLLHFFHPICQRKESRCKPDRNMTSLLIPKNHQLLRRLNRKQSLRNSSSESKRIRRNSSYNLLNKTLLNKKLSSNQSRSLSLKLNPSQKNQNMPRSQSKLTQKLKSLRSQSKRQSLRRPNKRQQPRK